MMIMVILWKFTLTLRPHDKGERAVGFMVSTATGTGGGVRGLTYRRSLALLALAGGRAPPRLACVSAFGYGCALLPYYRDIPMHSTTTRL